MVVGHSARGICEKNGWPSCVWLAIVCLVGALVACAQVVSGHSRGGHGALLMLTRRPDIATAGDSKSFPHPRPCSSPPPPCSSPPSRGGGEWVDGPRGLRRRQYGGIVTLTQGVSSIRTMSQVFKHDVQLAFMDPALKVTALRRRGGLCHPVCRDYVQSIFESSIAENDVRLALDHLQDKVRPNEVCGRHGHVS